MVKEVEKLNRAREIMNMLIQGVNPINGEDIDDISFLHNPKLIRCFSFIVDVLSKEIEYQDKKTLLAREKFNAKRLDLSKVEFPKEDCGINTIAGCINELVDKRTMKSLTGAQINKQLKAMGILSEEVDERGKTRTIITDESINYGITSIRSSYNGQE